MPTRQAGAAIGPRPLRQRGRRAQRAAPASMRKRPGILTGVSELVVSASSGTLLGVDAGRWVVRGRGRSTPIDEASVALLPLLEHPASEIVSAVKELDGPPFPWNDLL